MDNTIMNLGGVIQGISDLRDESDKSGIRVVIEIKRDAMAEVVLNKLYSFTPLTNFLRSEHVGAGYRQIQCDISSFVSPYVHSKIIESNSKSK